MLISRLIRILLIPLITGFLCNFSHADEREKIALHVVDVHDGASLQQALEQHADKPGVVKISQAAELHCLALEAKVRDEVSRHALLIPENIILDLNGATLLLDLRSNSHGVRLSNHSGIRNDDTNRSQ